jgi:hypothetical protein
MPAERTHGRHTVFKLGSADTPSTLVDLSSQLSEVSRAGDTPMADGTGFGDSVQRHVPGIPDFTLNITGFMSSDAHTQITEILNSNPSVAVDFEFGPLGDEAGNPQITGSVYLGNYNHTSPVGGLDTFTATAVVADAATFSDDVYGAS